MSPQAVRKLFHPQFKKFRKMQQEEIAQGEKNRMVKKVYQSKNKNQCHSFVLNSFGAEKYANQLSVISKI